MKNLLSKGFARWQAPERAAAHTCALRHRTQSPFFYRIKSRNYEKFRKKIRAT